MFSYISPAGFKRSTNVLQRVLGRRPSVSGGSPKNVAGLSQKYAYTDRVWGQYGQQVSCSEGPH